MTFKMTLKIQYGEMKRSLLISLPEVCGPDFEETVADSLREFRNMLAVAMPAGFSEEGNF